MSPLSWSDTTQGLDWDELSALYLAAPLGNKSPDWLKTAFGNSRYKLFIRDSGKLIAAGRAVADGVDVSYICDVAILPEHQRHGLGRSIVQRLVELSRGHRKIILYAVPGKEPFYRKLGFMRMATAMAIFENQAQQLERGYLMDE